MSQEPSQQHVENLEDILLSNRSNQRLEIKRVPQRRRDTFQPPNHLTPEDGKSCRALFMQLNEAIDQKNPKKIEEIFALYQLISKNLDLSQESHDEKGYAQLFTLIEKAIDCTDLSPSQRETLRDLYAKFNQRVRPFYRTNVDPTLRLVVTERSKQAIKHGADGQRYVSLTYEGYRRVLLLPDASHLPKDDEGNISGAACYDQDTIYLVPGDTKDTITAIWSTGKELSTQTLPSSALQALAEDYRGKLRAFPPQKNIELNIKNVVDSDLKLIRAITQKFNCRPYQPTPEEEKSANPGRFLFREYVVSYNKGDGKKRLDRDLKPWKEFREGKWQVFFVESPVALQVTGVGQVHIEAYRLLGLGSIVQKFGDAGYKFNDKLMFIPNRSTSQNASYKDENGDYLERAVVFDREFQLCFQYFKKGNEPFLDSLAGMCILRSIPVDIMEQWIPDIQRQLEEKHQPVMTLKIDYANRVYEKIWPRLTRKEKNYLLMRTLVLAIEAGKIGEVEEILNFADSRGFILPLDMPIGANAPAIFSTLFDKDFKNINREDRTVLQIAASTDHIDIVDLLINRGASLDTLADEGRATNFILVRLAALGDESAIKIVEEKGSNWGVPTKYVKTSPDNEKFWLALLKKNMGECPERFIRKGELAREAYARHQTYQQFLCDYLSCDALSQYEPPFIRKLIEQMARYPYHLTDDIRLNEARNFYLILEHLKNVTPKCGIQALEKLLHYALREEKRFVSITLGSPTLISHLSRLLTPETDITATMRSLLNKPGYADRLFPTTGCFIHYVSVMPKNTGDDVLLWLTAPENKRHFDTIFSSVEDLQKFLEEIQDSAQKQHVVDRILANSGDIRRIISRKEEILALPPEYQSTFAEKYNALTIYQSLGSYNPTFLAPGPPLQDARISSSLLLSA